jgi:hypothetical protein
VKRQLRSARHSLRKFFDREPCGYPLTLREFIASPGVVPRDSLISEVRGILGTAIHSANPPLASNVGCFSRRCIDGKD